MIAKGCGRMNDVVQHGQTRQHGHEVNGTILRSSLADGEIPAPCSPELRGCWRVGQRPAAGFRAFSSGGQEKVRNFLKEQYRESK